MLSVIGSPLVAGSFVPESKMATRVKVLRPFMYQGKATKADEIVELPDRLAFEVCASGKAALASAPAAAAPAPAAPKAAKEK